MHKLWSSKAMHAHSNGIRRRSPITIAACCWQEKRERNYCFINMRRAMLIHRVDVKVEVEKMMEEAIAKSLRA